MNFRLTLTLKKNGIVSEENHKIHKGNFRFQMGVMNIGLISKIFLEDGPKWKNFSRLTQLSIALVRDTLTM